MIRQAWGIPMLNVGWNSCLGNRLGPFAKEGFGALKLSFADLLAQALDGPDRALEMRRNFAGARTKVGKPVHAAYPMDFLQ